MPYRPGKNQEQLKAGWQKSPMRCQFTERGFVRRWYNFPQLGKESVSPSPRPLSRRDRGFRSHFHLRDSPSDRGSGTLRDMVMQRLRIILSCRSSIG